MSLARAARQLAGVTAAAPTTAQTIRVPIRATATPVTQHPRLRPLSTATESDARVPHRTHAVGLPADPEARTKLLDAYDETLRALDAIPADAAYRRNVEKITRHRRRIVASTTDVEQIEERIGVGRIEQVLAMARSELGLIDHVKRWRPWGAEARAGGGDKSIRLEVLD